MKLGRLFDGSGGFPLAGSLCGIEPVWAAEVEPYPIAVTRSRFPNMKHLGDVTKINGADIEPVDIIAFGSPCQDLSVAGKRAGLKHESNGDDETTRSGLFMEAIRIIKEMRGATNGIYPRFAVWENVVGAFSSNHGEDFRTVINEIVGIVEPKAEVPPMPKGGWAYADCYVGDRWSVAYRTFDAQYWGVPQRRRRIYLVADFGGGCAAEILFEREGLQGYFETARTPWKRDARGASPCVGATGFDGYNGDMTVDVCATLGVNCGMSTGGMGGNNQHFVVSGETPKTLKIRSGCEGGGKGALIQENKSATLSCKNDQVLFEPCNARVRYIVRRLTPTECARLQGFADNWGHPDRKDAFPDEEYSFWLNVRNTYAAINGKTVRQYTRQQMLAWYNKLHTDSTEYKMWGNGIALPCALYVMQGVKSFYQTREQY